MTSQRAIVLAATVVVLGILVGTGYYALKSATQNTISNVLNSPSETAVPTTSTSSPAKQNTPCAAGMLSKVSPSAGTLEEVPALFSGLTWQEVSAKDMELRWPGIGALRYIKAPASDYQNASKLSGKAWAASYTYQGDVEQIWNPFNKYYETELKAKGWEKNLSVRNFDVSSVDFDHPNDGSFGYIKIVGGKIRVLTLTHHFSVLAEGNSTTPKTRAVALQVFVSDPISLPSVLPGYEPATYLGVEYANVNKALKESYNLSVEYGALIMTATAGGHAVSMGSPAEKAGLKAGDIILAVDNIQITEKVPLGSIVQQHCPGDKINLSVLSDGIEKEIQVILGIY